MPSQSNTSPPVSLLVQAGLFISGTASAALAILKPMLVGALIDDYGLSDARAGSIAGIEMAGIGVAALLAPWILKRLNQLTLLRLGATLGLAGSLVPAVSDLFPAILVARLVAGAGCGLIASLTLGALGRMANPDQVLGRYYSLSYALGILIVAVGARVIGQWGAAGGYGLLAALLLIVYVVAPCYPEPPSSLSSPTSRTGTSTHVGRAAVLTLSASLCFWIALGGIWAFVERLGLAAGLDRRDVGLVFSLAPAASIGGALSSWWLGLRLGRALPLLGAVLLAAIASLLVGLSISAAVFAAGLLLLTFSWSMFLTYLGGAMSTIDRSGRLIAASVASQTLGMAIGPAVGGILAGRFGYATITHVGLGLEALAFLLLAWMFAALRPPPHARGAAWSS